MTTTLASNAKTFLTLLNARQVEYSVIGGYALAYHGYLRAIADLDVWIATYQHNAQKMVAVLHAFSSGTPAEAERFFQLPERVIHLGAQPPQVEVMTSISGVEFANCYADRIEDDLDGVSVSMIGLSCLKVNKWASIRPKDADDYAHLP